MSISVGATSFSAVSLHKQYAIQELNTTTSEAQLTHCVSVVGLFPVLAPRTTVFSSTTGGRAEMSSSITTPRLERQGNRGKQDVEASREIQA